MIFSYGQILLFYKEDIEEINKNNKDNITLEQDGATCHTSKANINLLNELFGKNKWIQNPPNFPDLAYPIAVVHKNFKSIIFQINFKLISTYF